MNLEQIIKNEIIEKGPMSFRDFVELALYHPDHGYYSSGRAEIGKGGDFYTSPTVHPSFGKVISNLVVRAFDRLNTENFCIVELGAGKGYLALDILDSIKAENPDIYKNLNYRIFETSEKSKAKEKDVLKKHSGQIEWLTRLKDLQKKQIEGVIVSNEFFDALPFHRLKKDGGILKEVFVDIKNENFVESLEDPSVAELYEYLESHSAEPAPSQEIEVNLEARKIIDEIRAALKSGFVLTIDYGYLADELYSPKRMNGTYRCFYRHELNSDPYFNIGLQDITADVNFSELVKYGEKSGLEKLKYINQGQFLVDWGILDILEKYKGEENKKDRLAIKNLMMPELMGRRFKILIQSKNVDTANFYRESKLQLIKHTL